VGMNAVLLDQKSDKDFEIKIHEDKEYIAVNNWCSFAEFLKQI
jgi:predicted nucleic acid-binding Zn finger protein